MDSGGWGHRSSATFIPWSGPYLVPYPYPYLYAPPGIMNYGYMMNQTGTSNDTRMMAVCPPPTLYAQYASSYEHDFARFKLSLA